MKKVGIIFGSIIDETFQFSAKEYYGGRYIYYSADKETEEEKIVVCEVCERAIKNRFLESPEAILYYDDGYDYDRDSIYIYKAKPINTLCKGRIIREKVPALPGHPVYTVTPDLIQQVYGISSNGKKIGYLREMPNCMVQVGIDDLFSPHMFIVGKTGSGKSYFSKLLFEKIASDFEYVIFAPTDEYNELGGEIYSDVVLQYNLRKIAVYVDLNMSETALLEKVKLEPGKVYSVENITTMLLDSFSPSVIEDNEQLSFGFAQEKNKQENYPRYADSLFTKLRKIRNLKFSVKESYTKPSGGKSIFDLSRYDQKEQECIIDNFLYQMKKKRSAKGADVKKKIIVMIEEAHNYVPSTYKSICKNQVVQLAREGRKLGISLGFITQRPRLFDQTALSQSGTKVIFSLSNPDDISHITEEMAYYKKDISYDIQKQKTGECLIIGDAFQAILECYIQL